MIAYMQYAEDIGTERKSLGLDTIIKHLSTSRMFKRDTEMALLLKTFSSFIQKHF